jgi:hypothetical protein
MARIENQRSRSCVTALGRLGELNMRVEPVRRRVVRLQDIARSIALEDSTQIDPSLDGSDPVEQAVRDWFNRDAHMGERYAATGDSAILEQRRAAKDAVRQRLQEAMDTLRSQFEAETQDAQEIQQEAMPCQGAVLVRPAVLEACDSTSMDSQVCAAAADTTPGSLFRFVDHAEDLWDVEEYRPWSSPVPIRVGQDGQSLVGARTASQARHGNIVVAVALAPMLRQRAQMTEAQAAEFHARLDSLGLQFDHPALLMAPALEIQANVPPPMAGETHYILHFGDVAQPDVVWSMSAAPQGGVVQAMVPANQHVIEQLEAGAPLSFTALKVTTPTEGQGPPEGQFVYTVGLTSVNEAHASTALLQYLGQGGLSRDLKQIIPADTTAAGG